MQLSNSVNAGNPGIIVLYRFTPDELLIVQEYVPVHDAMRCVVRSTNSLIVVACGLLTMICHIAKIVSMYYIEHCIAFIQYLRK